MDATANFGEGFGLSKIQSNANDGKRLSLGTGRESAENKAP
jgi:hypothetical protein